MCSPLEFFSMHLEMYSQSVPIVHLLLGSSVSATLNIHSKQLWKSNCGIGSGSYCSFMPKDFIADQMLLIINQLQGKFGTEKRQMDGQKDRTFALPHQLCVILLPPLEDQKYCSTIYIFPQKKHPFNQYT